VKELEERVEQLVHQVKTQEGALKNLREQNKALNTQMNSFKKSSSNLEIVKTELETQIAASEIKCQSFEF